MLDTLGKATEKDPVSLALLLECLKRFGRAYDPAVSSVGFYSPPPAACSAALCPLWPAAYSHTLSLLFLHSLSLADLNYNRCDIPEETWTGCESDVAYASYVPGSIVWAKQYGYPW